MKSREKDHYLSEEGKLRPLYKFTMYIAIKLQTHHGFFRKYNNAGANRRQQEKKGRLNITWIYSIKEAMVISLQELSRALENRTLWASLIHMVIRNQLIQEQLTHTFAFETR